MSNKQESRTRNTLFNFVSSVAGQVLITVMRFVVRTVFIQTLAKQYLGIEGLFSNIITMLSLAELGVGNAILFKLYDPIAKDDRKRIIVLVKFYKTVYRIIGLTVCILGLCLIPFLPVLIDEYDRLQELNVNAILIFLMFLLQSVSSYLFFAYKSTIIKANQKEYYINIAGYFVTLASSILQIIILVLFKNFEMYVLINVFSTILQNFVYARLVDKMYPYINDKIDDKIEKKEVIDTFKDCGALMLYKINDVVLKATDNIVISMFLGLGTVALYTNYYIFYTTLHNFSVKIFNSVTHSLGNLHTTNNKEHEYKIYKVIMLICAVFGGTCAVGIAAVSDEFVYTWVGEEWVLPFPFAILFGLELYTMPFRTALSKYRSSMGLFRQGMFRPLAGIIINIIVSVTLVNKLGICGVLIGTITADWLTLMIFDPIIIHKYGFENYMPAINHFKKFIVNFAVVALTAVADIYICRTFFVGSGWLSVIIHAVICGITVPAALILTNIKTEEWKYLYSVFRNLMEKLLRKTIKKNQ